ncbi:MAG: gliding motility-associated C-terminal domain-containing protein [Ferruginibacter sp.]|nr:gliding motility-associated C-terminal domain-containing protein [Ferruginibacter sp.]
MLLNRFFIFLFLLLFISVKSYAQAIPCTTLGQNPETAFPVCGTAVFHMDTVPICGQRQVISLCTFGIQYTDKNPFWYKFTCFQSGKLAFFIKPTVLWEDYDWQIFDVTGKNPQDVYTDTSTFVVCSWSGVGGVTGACEDSGGVNLIECEGQFQNRFTRMPDLIAGHNYLLLVSHFEDTQFGYDLSFGGPGNTAVITDTIPPHMFTASRATCDGSKILVRLNKRMKCSSLMANGTDFRISPQPPGITITSAVGFGCTNAFDVMDSVLITFSAPLPLGNYNLIAQKIPSPGDNNTLTDLCNNEIPDGESIPFTVLSPAPVPFESLTNNKCSTDSVIISFPETIKCSSVAPNGSDFFITGTYPVNISNAAGLHCVNGLTNKIVLRFNSALLQPGNFQVVLRVGSDGNTLLSECDTPSVAGITIPFEVLPKPVPDFAFSDTVCLPDGSVTFANLSVISDGSENAFQYWWNFDDAISGGNNFSTLKSPTHIYTGTGPFNVNLRVTSNGGCVKDTTMLVNTIHPQPLVNFGISKKDICLGDAVYLTDSTNSMDGPTVQWNWELGDGRTRNTQNVLHIYSAPQTYTVSLSTQNSFGCKSETLSKFITVNPYPTADAGPDRVVLEGGNITINAAATGNELKYLWSPSQYLNNPGLLTPKCVDVKFDILYTLTVTGKGGCLVTDDMFVNVLKIPRIPNTFSPNNDRINDLWEIQYLDEYINQHTQVFTRAGQKVFECRGRYVAWDGRYKGKDLPMDTYYYVIEPGSGRDPVTGYVTIIR